ncbi:hypothetical protein M885DRAFT_137089 [Pelagophyceae sp. CCMP2097]|nr:hypothetical protein M885DRAFT_137089 [Pelagophyceae sp. CCMP2097]|mmetsp:Transcript_29228/g.100816  ORF Transcript_29228/g.100816 Transcript_29228/m.100816 type:complete len:220 (-) Transcript_29228:146-805(-)
MHRRPGISDPKAFVPSHTGRLERPSGNLSRAGRSDFCETGTKGVLSGTVPRGSWALVRDVVAGTEVRGTLPRCHSVLVTGPKSRDRAAGPCHPCRMDLVTGTSSRGARKGRRHGNLVRMPIPSPALCCLLSGLWRPSAGALQPAYPLRGPLYGTLPNVTGMLSPQGPNCRDSVTRTVPLWVRVFGNRVTGSILRGDCHWVTATWDASSGLHGSCTTLLL